jgi:hypothetical protein
LEAVQNESPAEAAKLHQARNALLQKTRALEAQLRTAAGALKGEESRIQRLLAHLQKISEDQTRGALRLHQELWALDKRQQEVEAQWLQTLEADTAKQLEGSQVRKENQVLREQLQDLCKNLDLSKSSADAQRSRLERAEQESELLELQAALAKAEEEGCSLNEELQRLQGC